MSGILELPDSVRVRLFGSGGQPKPDILVSLHFNRSGEYYYGTFMGLTDHHGTVEISREQIERYFTENQRRFPMDYRIELSDCDPEVRILVRGGAEFRGARAAAEENPMIDPDVLQAYMKATNAEFGTAETKVDLSTRRRGPLTVDIAMQEADGS